MVDALVSQIDLSQRPFRMTLNVTFDINGDENSGPPIIEAESVIIATGADSRWLQVPGEYDFRGGNFVDSHIFSRCNVIIMQAE